MTVGIDLSKVRPGFPDPVHKSQSVFRAIMEAVARPGMQVTLSPAPTSPAPLCPAAGAVALTLLVNWAIKPFTMYAIAAYFLGSLLLPLIGPEAVDHVKLPLGVKLDVGDDYGALMAATVVVTAPLGLFFLFAQRLFIDGMTMTGLKG
jgi:hypothetical protein